MFFRIGAAGDDHCGSAVVHAGGIACCHLAAVLERRFEFGKRFEGGILPRAFVAVHHDHLPLATGQFDRDDLVLEFSGFLGGNRFLVAFQGEAVHRLAGHLIFVGDELGGHAHAPVLERIPEPVMQQRVRELCIAELQFP